MASERASQTTTLIYGGVAAEVGLVKTSTKPKAAQHDVRRLIGDLPADEARSRALAAWRLTHAPTVEQSEADALADDLLTPSARSAFAEQIDPFGVGVEAPPADATFDTRYEGVPTADLISEDPFAGLPDERVEHGVYLDDGTWLDLTTQLELIDERTRIEGMEVVATIHASSVPRTRVVGSQWITLAASGKSAPRQAKVLALLWDSLRRTSSAAVVRWTKRTNQALGIIVATGGGTQDRALALLECEWAQNFRAPGPKSTTPLMLPLSEREVEAASTLATSLRASAHVLDELRDERTGARADLLTAAREGRLDAVKLPAAPVPLADPAEDVAAVFEARAGVAI